MAGLVHVVIDLAEDGSVEITILDARTYRFSSRSRWLRREKLTTLGRAVVHFFGCHGQGAVVVDNRVYLENRNFTTDVHVPRGSSAQYEILEMMLPLVVARFLDVDRRSVRLVVTGNPGSGYYRPAGCVDRSGRHAGTLR